MKNIKRLNKKGKLVFGGITALVVVVVAVLIVFGGLGKQSKTNQAQKKYEAINAQSANKTIDKWSHTSNAENLILIVYKRTCTRCEENAERVQQFAEQAKKDNFTVVAVEAPQKGIVSSYPEWTKAFEIPQQGTPAVFKYTRSFYTSVSGDKKYLPIAQATISDDETLKTAKQTVLKK